MKRVLVLSIVVLGNAALAIAQTNDPARDAEPAPKHCSVAADDRAIRQIADDFRNGYNEGNAARVAALYADDATYMTQHYVTGIVQGRARIQAYVQNGISAKYRIDSIEVLSTTCSGDMAYALARYRSTNGNQKAMGVNLLVMRKIDGKWMIVAHESAVPDPATAIQKLDVK